LERVQVLELERVLELELVRALVQELAPVPHRLPPDCQPALSA
jgi:hypothetical protein